MDILSPSSGGTTTNGDTHVASSIWLKKCHNTFDAMSTIRYIDEVDIRNKRVVVRADFDVTLNPDFTIADDVRIQGNLPTLTYLLERKNKVICVAKLDRPKGRDPKLSLG